MNHLEEDILAGAMGYAIGSAVAGGQQPAAPVVEEPWHAAQRALGFAETDEMPDWFSEVEAHAPKKYKPQKQGPPPIQIVETKNHHSVSLFVGALCVLTGFTNLSVMGPRALWYVVVGAVCFAYRGAVKKSEPTHKTVVGQQGGRNNSYLTYRMFRTLFK